MTQRNKWRSAIELCHKPGAYQALAGLLPLLALFSLTAIVSSQQAFGRPLGLFRQSNQQSRGAGGGSDSEKNVRALEAGKSIKRELAGGQEHSYQVNLNTNQFLKVIVEQQGIDIVSQAQGPDGKPLLEFDSESRPQGQEEISLVAKDSGALLLVVRPKLNAAPAGSYEIRIEELRGATDTDRALHDARKQFEESLKLERDGKYDEAFPLAERSLEIRERLLGAEHLDVAAAINRLVGVYTRKGEYAKAEPLCLRALGICEKARGKDHPDTAFSLTNLAGLYREQGKYAEGETLSRRALDIYEKALGKDHPNTGAGVHSLALLYAFHGRYAEAEPLFKRTLDINEKALGKDHPDTAQSANDLGMLYTAQGRYAEAEPLFKRAISIRETALGENHPDISESASNLALLYYYQGKYRESEPLYKRALDINEKAMGKDHPGTAITLNNLAELYREQNRYVEAEPLFKRSINISEKALGEDHPDTAFTLNNLARLYRQQKKYAEAEPLFKRSLDINERILGENHPNTSLSLNNLAGLYFLQGKYAEAEPLFKRSLDIDEKALGKDHPSAIANLNVLAKLYMAEGDLAQAIKFQLLANAASERNLAYNLVTGSERDKLAYLATIPEQIDRSIFLHLRSPADDPAPRNMAATLILQRKGRTLDATSQNLNALRSRFNAEDQALLDRLTETRSQIAKLAIGGPQEMTAEQHRDQIKALENQADKDEADISRRSAEFRAQFLPVTLEAVCAAIPPDSALIEFVSYHPFNPKVPKGEETYGQSYYMAYVLRHDGEIKFRELGEAKAIDEAIAALRKALRDPKRVDVKRLARVVDAKVFQPVRPLLGDLTRLLISPDGPLNLIPFAALVNERGRYVIERYSISYLTSGRDLLRLQVARESKDGPMVVAAPDFGSRRLAEATQSKKREKEPSEGESKEESARSAIKEFYFPPLPDAAQEGKALSALLPGAILLTKRQATKAALSQIHGPKLLHIATHGFFLEDRQLPPAGGRGDQSISDDSERALKYFDRLGIPVEGPLLRSGLALAGANEHNEDDNGILTALEVTGLNLWGTKLVTLSACDTGVGEVKNGDGVHGLRRALVLAGAETQVMSLWAVSDKATREMMVSYYGRLKQGQGRGEALRQVQLEMLKKAHRRHPYYWASFIQSGERANLDGKR